MEATAGVPQTLLCTGKEGFAARRLVEEKSCLALWLGFLQLGQTVDIVVYRLSHCKPLLCLSAMYEKNGSQSTASYHEQRHDPTGGMAQAHLSLSERGAEDRRNRERSRGFSDSVNV